MIEQYLENILREHAGRVLSVKALGGDCYKIAMQGIQFKIKCKGAQWYNAIIKTQRNTYQVGQIVGVLDKHFLTELELIEKAVKGVNWNYHYIDDGITYRNAEHYYNKVKSMVENATDKAAAEAIWNKYKNS